MGHKTLPGQPIPVLDVIMTNRTWIRLRINLGMPVWRSNFSPYHAGLLHVEIPTDACTCSLQWISQYPVMIDQQLVMTEPCFKIISTFVASVESLCITRIYIHWFDFWTFYSRNKIHDDSIFASYGEMLIKIHKYVGVRSLDNYTIYQ